MVSSSPVDARATLESVARQARVSRQTVSNALHRPQVLSPDTLTRVQRAIDQLGYRPNRNAQSLRTGESRLIGLRVDPVHTPSGGVLDRFLHALAEGSRIHGYQLLVFAPAAPDDDLSGYRDLLSTMTVDAFVLTQTHHDDPRLAFLAERGTPVVSFGRPWGAEDDHHWVDVDGAAGTELAVDHLVRLGHRRIGFLGWPRGSDVGDDRREGWARALRRHGLEPGPSATAREDLAQARTRAGDLLEGAQRPTALVCASDVLAIGALHTLQRMGLRAGADIAVTGFDDSPAASLLDPALTSVAQPLEQVAAEVVRVLGTLLPGRPAPAPTSPSGVLVDPRLVVRDSTSPSTDHSNAPHHTEENA